MIRLGSGRGLSFPAHHGASPPASRIPIALLQCASHRLLPSAVILLRVTRDQVFLALLAHHREDVAEA